MKVVPDSSDRCWRFGRALCFLEMMALEIYRAVSTGGGTLVLVLGSSSTSSLSASDLEIP